MFGGQNFHDFAQGSANMGDLNDILNSIFRRLFSAQKAQARAVDLALAHSAVARVLVALAAAVSVAALAAHRA